MTEYIAEIDRLYSAYLAIGRAAGRPPGWAEAPEARRLWRAHLDAKQAAGDAFAALNGWRMAPAFTNLDRLGRGGPTRSHHWTDNGRDRRLLDHAVWFYRARRFIAAVGQPYPTAVDDLPWWRASLAERDLVLHEPPDPLASIHYPGATLFVVVTRPGVEVHFLPEQDGRLAERWARREAEAPTQSADGWEGALAALPPMRRAGRAR